ncbi:VOC family protein [Mobilitalea sibirica]|uniref:VOC family protein n=1 Tax=Mobilitalea sibirica TaxID=1462919 RepID=A0A8J7L2B7_9FIRM|nr:VOC family protein [Mobilitalea sibirica]
MESGKAKEAIRYYVEVFEDSEIGMIRVNENKVKR